MVDADGVTQTYPRSSPTIEIVAVPGSDTKSPGRAGAAHVVDAKSGMSIVAQMRR